MEKKANICSIACQKLTEYLESHAMRKTPERYEVLQTVCMTNGIFSIDALDEEMHKNARFQVSRATLFNTMELLVKTGMVVKHPLQRAFLYEANIAPSPMACLVCTECDSVTKLENAEVTEWLNNLRLKNFTIQQPILYVQGLCKKCQNAKNKKTKNRNKEHNI